MGSTPANIAPQFIVIGAGSRGHAYAKAVNAATSGKIVAVADIDAFKRQSFGRQHIWGDGYPTDGQSFTGWQEYLDWELETRQNSTAKESRLRIDGVFICVLDELHVEVIKALAPLNLHVFCEKPLALSLQDCLDISASFAANPPAKIVSIGHVLRYSTHNMTLRKLVLEDDAIGEIVSVEHTEPVGWWHFSHSYVRGNWRRSHEDGVGSLLTKSCHDIDFILWMMCSPSSLTGKTPHFPSTISSSGAVTHFRKSRKPKLAGTATNCLSCPAEPECMYSSRKIYIQDQLRRKKETGWPVKIVVPEIEDIVRSSSTTGWDDAEKRLLEALSENYDKTTTSDAEIAKRPWYGRCVYESDNNVVDDQTVTIAWDDETDNDNTVRGRGPKQALFHMTYPTKAQCDRRGRIYGTQGELEYDSKKITIHSFADYSSRVIQIPRQSPEIERAHGGGDWGLAAAFVDAIQAVDSGTMSVNEAQWKFVGCDLEEIIRSHAVVFAAEEARIGRKVVQWDEWCERKGIGNVMRQVKKMTT